jgi:hypothetical protein
MAKMTKTAIDKVLRDAIFEDLMLEGGHIFNYHKINDRQYGIIMSAPPDGTHRYCRIGVIVAEEREDMTAEELMQAEIDAYNQKQADKAEKAKAKEKKIAKDKARREAEAKSKEEK